MVYASRHRTAQVRTPRATAIPYPASMVGPWRLVGRDEELNFLTEALAGADHGGCVLSGRSGVGKTRLALEAAERAKASGRDVEWLVATHGTSEVSLGALAPALGVPPPAVSEGELLHWAGRQLAARSDLVVCVDDAHLLDAASASILLQLAARREGFVLATIRSGADCPEAVVSLWKDGWAERMEVLPLALSETVALAQEFLAAELTADTADLVCRLSAGVPLYLRELLIAAVEEGSVVETAEGRKAWRGPLVPNARLGELVTTRLSRLTDDEREALLTVALGEPLDLQVAEQVVDAAKLSRLEQRGMTSTLIDRDRPVVRLSHPLYGEVLRARAPTATSREVHRRLAQALETVGYNEDDLLRLARWRLDCGDPGDPALLLVAGERALRTFDTGLAERLGRAAADADGGPPALRLVADALYFASRWDEATMVLNGLVAGDMDDDTRAAVAMRQASLLIWSAGDPDAAHGCLAAAAEQVADPALRAEIDAERVWPLVVSHRLEEASAAAAPYVGEGPIEPRAAMRALPPYIVGSAIRGRTGDALRAAERAVDLLEEATETVPTSYGELLAASCLALWLDGQLRECTALVDSMGPEGSSDWSDEGRGLIGFIRSKMALEGGQATEAVRRVEAAIEALRGNDIGMFLPWAHYVRARAAASLGDAATGRQALADGDECRVPAIRLAEPDRLLAMGAVTELTEPGRGRADLLEGVERFASEGAYPYALLALVEAVRLGHDDASAADRATELAAGCQGRLGPVATGFVESVVTGDPDRLRVAAGELEEIGLDLVGAETALMAAVNFEQEGQGGSALEARQFATGLLERCGPVETRIVTIYGADAPLARLTSREQEVARLVGTGLTNREVADRLHISERTVDNHVQHIFTKLGINDRNALRHP